MAKLLSVARRFPQSEERVLREPIYALPADAGIMGTSPECGVAALACRFP
jgi:hypothetical protein